MAGQQQALSDYQATLRLLLHDPNDAFWPLADKTTYINQGMQRRDLDTGANRQLITFTLVAATDTYTFTTMGNANVFDVVAINLIYVSTRVVLQQYSFTELNAKKRMWQASGVNWQSVPEAWCRYGPNQVIFAPNPVSAYTTEWDCCIYSSPLVATTDKDPVVYPYTDPVPYYAAYVAKLNERQYDEAAQFLQLYQEKINSALNTRVGFSPSIYGAVTHV